MAQSFKMTSPAKQWKNNNKYVYDTGQKELM